MPACPPIKQDKGFLWRLLHAGWLKSRACWVEILFLLPTCATPDPLHHLFEPQFCPLLNGNHEDTHVGVLCLHLYVFRKPVNGSASKQKAGFPWPTKTESCTFGPGLISAWLVPPLAQCQVLWFFFFHLRPQSQVRAPWEGSEGSRGSALSPSLSHGWYAQASINPDSWS